MNIEQPRFPTPEDERCASLLWQTMHELVDVNIDMPPADAPGMEESTKAGSERKPVKL
jgi:hypothetical protein